MIASSLIWCCATLISLLGEVAPSSGMQNASSGDAWAASRLSANAELVAPGSTLKIERSVAGRSVRVRVLGDGAGRYKLRGTVKRRDGSRVDLPGLELQLPLPSSLEGPLLPAGSAGGTLVLELIEVATGNVVDTGVAPIG